MASLVQVNSFFLNTSQLNWNVSKNLSLLAPVRLPQTYHCHFHHAGATFIFSKYIASTLSQPFTLVCKLVMYMQEIVNDDKFDSRALSVIVVWQGCVLGPLSISWHYITRNRLMLTGRSFTLDDISCGLFKSASS